jgi:hypothetical protein
LGGKEMSELQTIVGGDIHRIANALESIAHDLDKNKSVHVARVAANRRISNAVAFINTRIREIEEGKMSTMESIRVNPTKDMEYIRDLLLEP